MSGKTYLQSAQKGRDALSSGEYGKAIGFFKYAIERGGGTTSVYYSLRAKAIYLQLQSKENTTDSERESAWNRIIADCDSALEFDKNNIDAKYYKALHEVEFLEDCQNGMSHLEEVYEQAIEGSKNSKKYVLPQEIYQKILKLKMTMRTAEYRKKMASFNPLYERTVSLLEKSLNNKLDEFKKSPSYTTRVEVLQQNHRFQDDVENLSLIFSYAMKVTEDTPVRIDPPHYLCDPISFNLFHDPVITPSGRSYERSWLFPYLETHECDPLTRTKLTASQCYPNTFLKECVEAYIKESLFEEDDDDE